MSVEISVEINGFDDLMRAVDRHDANTKHNAGLGLVAFGQEMVRIIREHYVPVRTDAGGGKAHVGIYQPHQVRTLKLLRASVKRAGGGTLRASIGSSYYRERGDGWLEIVIAAGQPGSGAEKYAAVVHEKLTLKHVIGQAKYIETPLALNASKLTDYLVKSVRFTGKLSEINYDSTILLNPADYD